MNRNPKSSETAIKICGITRADDAKAAREAGADFIGVIVEVDVSPRSVRRTEAVRLLEGADGVALTYDAPVELCEFLAGHARPAALQLAGMESAAWVRELAAAVDCEVWKSMHLAPAGEAEVDVAAVAAQVEEYAEAGVAAVVLDTAMDDSAGLKRGGTGRRHDWEAAARIVARSAIPIVLAGGLNAANVAEAVEVVHPAAVDVSSGVEIAPGVKSSEQVEAFVSAARRGCQWPLLS